VIRCAYCIIFLPFDPPLHSSTPLKCRRTAIKPNKNKNKKTRTKTKTDEKTTEKHEEKVQRQMPDETEQ